MVGPRAPPAGKGCSVGRNALGHFPQPPGAHRPWLTPRGITPQKAALRAVQNLSTAHRPRRALLHLWFWEGGGPAALCRSAPAPLSLKGLLVHFPLIERPGCPVQSWAQGSWS